MSDRGGWPIWQRLTLTCIGLALLAVLIVAGLSAVLAERSINVLVQERRNDLTSSLLVDAASTYNTGRPSWSDADLKPALELAAQSGTDVAVVDNQGNVVAATFADPRHAPGAQKHPIELGNRQIGTLYVRFNGRGLVQSADDLRRSLIHAEVASAGIAALLALAGAVIVSRRLSNPVHRLTAAAAAMGQGDRTVRLGPLERAPSELRELASTFDSMADALEHQEQLRRDLVADVAHELRTPVAILQANCEALIDGIVAHTPEQTMSLHEETVRLAAMVEDLQALASAEAAALHLSYSRCDLATIVDVAVDAMELNAVKAGIELRRDLAPALINGDPVRLHQITTNVLSNAIKFTPSGGTVDVSVHPDGGRAALRIHDTGAGISAADLPHVFGRFWRGPAAGATSGTGIGLAIVENLVTAHGGEVTIASEPGTGTRVQITLPLAD